eukprot:gene12161-13416_t
MDGVNEFVIPFDKGLIIRNQFCRQIETLFHVRLEFTTDWSTAQRTGNEWIKICGNENDRKKAEEYTKGITNPETRVFFLIPPFLQNQVSWNRNEVIWQVQRESNALVQVENVEKLYLQGSEMSVASAISLLECRINYLKHQHSFSAIRPPMSSFASSKPGTDIVAKGAEIASSPSQPQVLPRGSAPKPNYDQLRDFATKLGYSEDEIKIGISKCTNFVNENSLLKQLITLFPRNGSYDVPVTKSSGRISSDCSDSASNIKSNLPKDLIQTTLQSSDAQQSKKDKSKDNKLRHIVVDGSNVAMSHGNREVFSCKGIMICVDYFKKRGHSDITVFVPHWRKETSNPERPIVDQQILTDLEKERILAFTPSRKVNGRRVVCYDDRYIVRFAAENDGIIVSNDNFRDLEKENSEWKKVIEERLLMYTFVKDCFMPPDDPLGRHGPKLDEFLKKGTVAQPRLCPYKKKCTFGQKCKYYHPERMERSSTASPKNMQMDAVKEGGRSSQSADANTSLLLLKKDMDTKQPQQQTMAQTRNNHINKAAEACGQEQKQWNTLQKSAQPSIVNTESTEAFQLLQNMFPENVETIKKIITENPKETDPNKLADLLLRAL